MDVHGFQHVVVGILFRSIWAGKKYMRSKCWRDEHLHPHPNSSVKKRALSAFLEDGLSSEDECLPFILAGQSSLGVPSQLAAPPEGTLVPTRKLTPPRPSECPVQAPPLGASW